MNETPRIPANTELGASTEQFQNLHEFVRKARANLNQNAWDYIVGAAETETTMRRNRLALDEIAFRPRVLRNVARVDASAQLFGRKFKTARRGGRHPPVCERTQRLPRLRFRPLARGTRTCKEES